MPLYEFVCGECGHTWEVLQGVNEPRSDVPCPACNRPSGRTAVAALGGYTIKGNNSASVRPKQAGAFKTRKV